MAPSYDEAHPVVYANCLACQKRGHALWFPEGPDGSDEVQVGDVGYINRDGKFLFLFNIEEKANTSPTRGMRRFLSSKPCNFFDFENPDVIITTTADELQPNVYTSKSMTKRDIAGKVGGGVATIAGAGVKVEYSVGEDQGAACWLPEPGAQRQVESSTLLRQYVKDNLEDWYEEIKKRQHIKLDDLVVVNGTIKSPQYKVTAVISAQKSRMAEFNANAMNVVDLGLHIRLVNHGPPRAEQRQLLFDDGKRPDPVKALSIFLRYYKMKQRLFRKKIEANAGPHVLPPGEDPSEGPLVPANNAILVDERDSEVEGARPYLPVDALLDYILEACPEAEHALACDEDVYSLFLGEELPDDVISALRQKEPRIVIDERKIGSLVLEDVIRRERVHKITGRPPSSLLTDDDDLGEPPLRDATVTFRDSAGNEKTIEWPHQHLSDKAQQQGSLKATSISPDGKIIAVGFDDASIILWELATSTVVKHLSGHEDGVYALAFSPNGTKLASGSADMKIIVWSVIADKDEDGNDIEDNDFPILEGHELDVTKVAYSPDGTRLVSGALDGVLKIWDATQGYALLRTINNVTSPQWVSYTPDSRKIVATMDHNVCVWNPVSGAKLVEMRGHEANIYMVDFSHDGARIATASEDQTARVWNLETGEELLTLHEHSAPIWCVAFSKDDNEVATGSDDTTVVIADSWTGQRRAVITDHGGLVNTLAYSKSGDWLCSGTMEGNVRLLDARSGEFVAEYQGHADKIRSVAFSPEADAIITSSEDGTIRTFSATDILRMR